MTILLYSAAAMMFTLLSLSTLMEIMAYAKGGEPSPDRILMRCIDRLSYTLSGAAFLALAHWW